MPRLKNSAAKPATNNAGTAATTPNSRTSRTCSRDPAAPRRRSSHMRVRRAASEATSSKRKAILARITPANCPAPVGPIGVPPESAAKVASPISSAKMARQMVKTRPVTISPSRLKNPGGRGALCPWGGKGAARPSAAMVRSCGGAGSSRAAHHGKFQFPQLLPQRIPIEPEHSRRLDLIASCRAQCHAEQGAFNLSEYPVV